MTVINETNPPVILQQVFWSLMHKSLRPGELAGGL